MISKSIGNLGKGCGVEAFSRDKFVSSLGPKSLQLHAPRILRACHQLQISGWFPRLLCRYRQALVTSQRQALKCFWDGSVKMAPSLKFRFLKVLLFEIWSRKAFSFMYSRSCSDSCARDITSYIRCIQTTQKLEIISRSDTQTISLAFYIALTSTWVRFGESSIAGRDL